MKKDRVMNEYVKKNEVFADIVNLCLYQGRNVIQSADLQECDPTYPDKRRDVLKECVIKEDHQNRYVLFGIENQSEMDPSMPIRVMGYDVREYERQLSKKRNPKGLRGGEFLSGIQKGMKVKPVITIVIYEGPKKWEGARSLKEMVDELGEGMEEVFNDYRVNILEPSQIEEESCKKCRSGMGKILTILKYSYEKEKMIEYLRKEENREVDEETAKVVEVITKIPMNVTEKGGKIDMCKATEEYTKECKEIGRAEGITEGIESGRKEAEISIAKRMLETGSFTTEMIAMITGLSGQAIHELRNQTLIKA